MIVIWRILAALLLSHGYVNDRITVFLHDGRWTFALLRPVYNCDPGESTGSNGFSRSMVMQTLTHMLNTLARRIYFQLKGQPNDEAGNKLKGYISSLNQSVRLHVCINERSGWEDRSWWIISDGQRSLWPFPWRSSLPYYTPSVSGPLPFFMHRVNKLKFDIHCSAPL